MMPVNNGDSSRKNSAVATEESSQAAERSEAPVLESQERGTQASRAHRALQDHPRKALAGFVVLLVIVAGAVYFIRNAFLFESTDDAQVDGHIMPLSARISGYVLKVPVMQGQLVQAREVLEAIDPKAYEISVNQAEAALADALAGAASSRYTVPITSVTTHSNLQSAETAVMNAEAGLKAAEQNFESAKAALDQAEANSTKSNADLTRYEKLVAKEEISRQQYDAAVAGAAANKAAVASATALAHSAEQAVRHAQGKLLQASA